MVDLNNISFQTLAAGQEFPGKLSNAIALRSDGWDDYTNKVRFDVYWFDPNGVRINLGKTKILRGSAEDSGWVVDAVTEPPVTFVSDIGGDFISLGQSEGYYTRFHETFGSKAEIILEALRDIAVLPGLAGPFETSSAFRNGMMRENTAWRARQYGRTWSRGEVPVENPSFVYECTMTGEEESVAAVFDFSPADILPGRVVGIIGRNAVGKTRFLAQLSKDLTQVRQVSAAAIAEREKRFPTGQPLFTRVLAVSYSAFDRFQRPEARPESSYIYCGIRDEKGNLSQVGLERSFRSNKKRVHELNRISEWTDYLEDILGPTSGISRKELVSEVKSHDDNSRFLARLSSGQAILCHFVTGMLAWLQPQSIVLIDEPETHLHPNAVANLFVVLSHMLKQYSSYCVAATHSPLVIQEIPSKRVLMFTRDDGTTSASLLAFESFGESLAELTDHVFNTQEAVSLYRAVLDRIAQKYTMQEALELFKYPLSMNAKSYLLARYSRGSGK